MKEFELLQKLQEDFTIIELHPLNKTDMLAYGLYNYYPFTIFFYWENEKAYPYVLRHGFYGSLHEKLCKQYYIHPELLKHRTCPICHELQFDREAYDCFALHENPTQAANEYVQPYDTWEVIIEEDPNFLFIFPENQEFNDESYTEIKFLDITAKELPIDEKENTFNVFKSSFFDLFSTKIKQFKKL